MDSLISKFAWCDSRSIHELRLYSVFSFWKSVLARDSLLVLSSVKKNNQGLHEFNEGPQCNSKGFCNPVIPNLIFVQSRNSDNHFWHPASHAGETRIPHWFCFQIQRIPSFERGKYQIPENLSGTRKTRLSKSSTFLSTERSGRVGRGGSVIHCAIVSYGTRGWARNMEVLLPPLTAGWICFLEIPCSLFQPPL